MADQQEGRSEDVEAFIERLRGGVANLPAPEEIADDWRTFVFETAFENVWARPGLSLRERSIATISALTVLGREAELRSHLRIGLTNGLTKAEIGELLLHLSVYGGIPVGVGAMRLAREVFEATEN